MDIAGIQARLAAFADERDWEQFHSPKNLAMALAGEVGELLEVFQWLTQAQSKRESLTDQQVSLASDELADVLIYALRLADKLEIDIEAAINSKINKNATRYTIEASRGNTEKR